MKDFLGLNSLELTAYLLDDGSNEALEIVRQIVKKHSIKNEYYADIKMLVLPTKSSRIIGFFDNSETTTAWSIKTDEQTQTQLKAIFSKLDDEFCKIETNILESLTLTLNKGFEVMRVAEVLLKTILENEEQDSLTA